MDKIALVRQLRERSNFLGHLAATTYTRNRVLDSRLTGAPYIFPAGTQQLDPCIGPSWIAVGDVATAFDPLSSLGIGHALVSGIQGARIVDERLRGSEELAGSFRTDVEIYLNTFRIQHRRFYAMERRWSSMPFWKDTERPDVHGQIPEHIQLLDFGFARH
jgi:flavin-dependent dehydrogenase